MAEGNGEEGHAVQLLKFWEGGLWTNGLLVFAVCYAFFHIMPALIDIEIKYKFWVGDLLDLFTPFIMILLVYKLYRLISIGNSGNELKPSIKVANFLILINMRTR